MDDIAAVILAAGASRRYGAQNKLLRPYRGRLLLEHTLSLVARAEFSERIVVIRPLDDALAALCRTHDVRVVPNLTHDAGLATSIGAGVGALKHPCAGVAIFLGDMPLIPEYVVRSLIDAFRNDGGARVVRPAFEGAPGHPVIFPSTTFVELQSLTDDHGASSWLRDRSEMMLRIPIDDRGIVVDMDTPKDFEE
jgi:molybdenum cofactor cytidylyltransferase